MTVVSVEVVRDAASLQALRAEWDALVDVAAGATPFQRPGWIVPWMENMGIETPCALALRCGGDLVGLLPAFLRGPDGDRTFSLMGAGSSDHLDAIAAVGFERSVLDAVHDWLEETRGQWRSCTFDELGPRALLRELAPPAGAHARIDPQSVCPVLVAADGDFEAVVPRPQLARLSKARRRVERMGELELRRRDRGDDLLQTLHALIALHAKRWELRREAGVLGDARVRRLHEDVVNAFAARGMVRLYSMHMGGTPAAVVYGFREGARLHLYLQAVEPALERLDPGTVLVGFVIEDALREGVREVDFLRGGEPSKYAWGAMDEANARVCIAA